MDDRVLLTCDLCPLSPKRGGQATRVVPGGGPTSAEVMVIGEAPGQWENLYGVPFFGRAGQLLNDLLGLAGLKREAVYVTNTVKCWPPVRNGKQSAPSKKELKTCTEAWLWQEVAEVKPSLVITLGATPLKVFFPHDSVSDVHGQVRQTAEGLRVATMYHPAAALHAPQLQQTVFADFKNLPEKLKASEQPEYVWQAVTTPEQFTTMKWEVENYVRAGGQLAVDFETTDLRPAFARLVGVAVAGGTDRAWYVHSGSATVAELTAWVSDLMGRAPTVCHNGVFESAVLLCLLGGVSPKFRQTRTPTTDVWSTRTLEGEAQLTTSSFPSPHDTMILAALLGEPKGLKALALAKFGMNMTPIEELIGPAGPKQKTMDEVPVEQAAPYACADAIATARLFPSLKARLDEREQALYDMERALIPVVAGCMAEGIRLDAGALKIAREMTEQGLSEKLAGLRAAVGDPEFNPNSPPQVCRVLGTTDAQEATVLESEHPLALDVVEAKHLSKLLGSYIEKAEAMLPRAYGSFNLVGTGTGRMSASGWDIKGEKWGLNLQTIPRGDPCADAFRRAFVPDEGYVFVEVDWSQIELRLTAEIAPERAMREAYAAGRDLHNEMMQRGGISDRRAAKVMNFSQVYEPFDEAGCAVLKRAFAKEARVIISWEQAREFRSSFKRAWPDLPAYYRRIHEELRERGYVQTLRGRKFRARFAEGKDKATWKANKDLLKQAVNMPVQGTAADAFKQAWVGMAYGTLEWDKSIIRPPAAVSIDLDYQPLGWPITWKVPVHDSYLVQVPAGRERETFAYMREWCETIGPLWGIGVPLKVEGKAGPNWGEMQPL